MCCVCRMNFLARIFSAVSIFRIPLEKNKKPKPKGTLFFLKIQHEVKIVLSPLS